eukprot:PhM_4_TR409/c2_g1_i1/m.75988
MMQQLLQERQREYVERQREYVERRQDRELLMQVVNNMGRLEAEKMRTFYDTHEPLQAEGCIGSQQLRREYPRIFIPVPLSGAGTACKYPGTARDLLAFYATVWSLPIGAPPCSHSVRQRLGSHHERVQLREPRRLVPSAGASAPRPLRPS